MARVSRNGARGWWSCLGGLQLLTLVACSSGASEISFRDTGNDVTGQWPGYAGGLGGTPDDGVFGSGDAPYPTDPAWVDGEPGAANAQAFPTGAPPDSRVLDHCRLPLPGITPVGDGAQTLYDSSAFSSSQSFALSGSGEWDDNANYRRFLDAVAEAPVHENVDVSNRQFVVVLDEDGRGVGNCPVQLTDPAGTDVTLTTLPSGRVPVFPALYGFEGPLSVTASCLSRTGTATLSLESADDVAIVQLDAARRDPATPTLDLAFVLDVTGSMAAEIEAMKQTIDDVATEIVSTGQSRVRLALVAYRDYTDGQVFQTVSFTEDLAGFRDFVGALRATGGGDEPEAVNEAMDWTTRLDWNPDATARMAFVIGDAPPHPFEGTSAAQAAAVLYCGGVKVFSVATTGQTPTGRFVFRQMSQLTYATHLFLLRGGAAPDSDCADYEFRTGELHNLVVERVQGELASPHDDPLAIPGLGSDRDTEIAAALDACATEASIAAGEDIAPSLR